MMKKFSVGDKIWMSSIVLYCMWAFFGLMIGIESINISIYGSIGMIVFVIVGNLIRLKL